MGEPATLVLIGSGTTDGTTKADPNTVYDITTPSATRKAGAFYVEPIHQLCLDLVWT